MEISEVSVSIDGQESFRLTLLPLDTSEPNLDNFMNYTEASIIFENGVQYNISISYEPVGSGSEWMLDSVSFLYIWKSFTLFYCAVDRYIS